MDQGCGNGCDHVGLAFGKRRLDDTQAVGERVALVTGAAQGLGRAIADALAKQGVSLMLVDVLADRLRETQASLEDHGAQCAAFAADISERANCVAAVDDTIDRFGRLDVLVDAAGLMRLNPATEVPEEEFWRTMRVNAATPFWFAQAAIPHLLNAEGNIVNVLSQSALMGTSNIVPYSNSVMAACDDFLVIQGRLSHALKRPNIPSRFGFGTRDQKSVV